jgi:2-haloacid dehalogenase
MDRLCNRYVEVEIAVESGPYRSYREVMAHTLARLMEEAGMPLPAGEEDALGRALPGWEPFPEVPAVLARLQDSYRLGILSNIDDDLLEASVARLGVHVTHRVTAAQVRSYKPFEAHFRRILEHSGLQAGEILHVAGSLLHDMVPARKLGFRHLWVNRLGEPRPDWLPAHQEIHDLTTLAEIAATAGQ